MRYHMNLVARLMETQVSAEQPASHDPEMDNLVHAMENRGIKRLMEQGKSREEATRITREAMNSPLTRKIPSFDEL